MKNTSELAEGISITDKQAIEWFDEDLEYLKNEGRYEVLFLLFYSHSNTVLSRFMYLARYENDYSSAVKFLSEQSDKLKNIELIFSHAARGDIGLLESVFSVLFLSNNLSLANKISKLINLEAVDFNEEARFYKVRMFMGLVAEDEETFSSAYNKFVGSELDIIDKRLHSVYKLLYKIAFEGVLDHSLILISTSEFEKLQTDKDLFNDPSTTHGGGPYEPFVLNYMLLAALVFAKSKGLILQDDFDHRYAPKELINLLHTFNS